MFVEPFIARFERTWFIIRACSRIQNRVVVNFQNRRNVLTRCASHNKHKGRPVLKSEVLYFGTTRQKYFCVSPQRQSNTHAYRLSVTAACPCTHSRNHASSSSPSSRSNLTISEFNRLGNLLVGS